MRLPPAGGRRVEMSPSRTSGLQPWVRTAGPQGSEQHPRGARAHGAENALGRRRASPKGIADLARDAAFQTRRDTKLLTRFFLFPFKTTSQAVLRESHMPDLTDFFPE